MKVKAGKIHLKNFKITWKYPLLFFKHSIFIVAVFHSNLTKTIIITVIQNISQTLAFYSKLRVNIIIYVKGLKPVYIFTLI